MALKDLVKKVRLALDRKSAEQMERDTKRSLSTVDKGLASLKKAAVRLGAALAAAFAVRAVVNFGKEVVRVAAEADAIWKRLGQAVENVGINFADARPEIEQFARAMQDATTVGDEDFAAVLTELITTSNDYGRSLEAVGVVADLAAAKQIDLRTAAQLVGRAMIGETGTFKRYGIIVKEGEDAMEVLRRQFRGFAEREATSVQGKMLQLNNEWSDFKQALGEAVIAGAEGESMLDRLTESVKRLTENISFVVQAWNGFTENFETDQAAIRRIIRENTSTEDVLRGLKTFRERTEQELALLRQKLEGMPSMWSVLATGRDYWEWKRNHDLTVQEIENLERTLNSLAATAQGVYSGRIQVGPSAAPPPPPPPGGEDLDDAVEKTKTLQDLWMELPGAMIYLNEAERQQAEHAERLTAGWERLNSEMEMSPKNAAKLADELGKVADTAELGQLEMMKMSQAADIAGSLMAGVFGGNIGEIAKWKAEQNAIMAAEQIAMGVVSSLNPITAPKAPGHYAAAKMFAGVAAAWGALAAATGGFSGGGGGGARGGPRDTGGAASERAQQPGPEVHIYLQGDFDALNPRVQQTVYGAVENYQQRYGNNAKTYLHRSKKP